MKNYLLINRALAAEKKLLSLFTALLFVGTMWGAEYQLVKSVSDLEAGARYVIGATYNTNTYFASTTSSDNNRKLVTATVSNEKVTASETMMTFTLGGSTGAWTFLTNNYAGTNGYLNATNTTSNNYLKVVAKDDDYNKFSISITDAGGATIKCTGKNSRDTMYLYQSSQISCYSNNSSASYIKPGLYKEIPADIEAPTITSSNNKNYFQGSVNISLSCATNGATIYYTIDGSNPSSNSTAYNSPFTLDATKTVKAIAILGENASDITSKKFTLCPTEMTCAEARTAVLSLSGTNVPYADGLTFTVLGYVTEIQSAWTDNKITFWIADAANGGRVLEAYNAACDEADAPVVGESVEVTGSLLKYNNTTPEFTAGCTFTKVPRPYITPSPTSLNFNTVEKDAVVAAKTVTLSGANLTDAKNVTVTAPAGYNVSVGEDTPAASLTLTPSNGVIAATIKVTPITNVNGTFNGNLTIETDDLGDDVIVALAMTVTERFTVSFSTGIGNPTISPIQEATVLAGVELPASVTPAKEGWTFAGWAEAVVASKTTTAPTLNAGGSTYHPTEDVTLYAVYSQTVGAVPPYGTVTVTYNSTNFPTGYGEANTFTEYTLEGYKFKIQQICKSGNKMQWRASGNTNGTGTIYNTQTFPNTISSIILTYDASDGNKNHTLYVGDSENPTSGTEITGTKNDAVETFDCSAEDANYFVLANGENAGYTTSIAINYGDAGTTYYVSSPSDVPTALDNTEMESTVVKVLRDGVLYIEKGGKRFNVQGQVVK